VPVKFRTRLPPTPNTRFYDTHIKASFTLSQI
jgi:hypothetical protein